MASVDLAGTRTSERDAARAADALVRDLVCEPKLFVFFAARDLDHVALNRALRARLPRTRLIGASTGRQIDAQGQHEHGIVGAALTGDFEVGIGCARRLARDPVRAGASAMLTACADLGVEPTDLSKRHVGMVVPDGYVGRNEELLLGMLEPNPGLALVGGGASDARVETPTSVIHVDDEVMDNAALLVLFQTDARWAAMRSHWYDPTGRHLTITKVDPLCRRALEIDGKPAAKRYAELLGVNVADLGWHSAAGFAKWPTAIAVGREYVVRAPWKVLDDGSVLFANLVEEGMELEIMHARDLAGATRKFLAEEMAAKVGPPTAALVFTGAGRRWFSDVCGRTAEVSQAFAAAPRAVGMESYFELYRGFSLNTTLSALVFGRS